MQQVQEGTEKRENILTETIQHLKPILTELKKHEATIGEALTDAIKKAQVQERTIGTCPTCHTGKLMILYSKRTHKRFIGCTNYFKATCNTSYPLPQRGTVKTTHRLCPACGWPLLYVHEAGRRPWNLCFNPTCPKKPKRNV